MKRQIKLVAICAVLVGGLVSCLDDKEPIWYFYDEPALVKFEDNIPIIKTTHGDVRLASLSDTLKSGDYLWTSFTVDLGNQPYADETLATNFNYKKIGVNTVKFATGEMDDDYTDVINVSSLYQRRIGNTLFFNFEHDAAREQQYDYEIICNTDSLNTSSDGQEVPTLYLRSKKTHVISGRNNVTVVHHFGFDMTQYIEKYKINDKNTVELYIKYLHEKKDGKDVYKSFKTKPITVQY